MVYFSKKKKKLQASGAKGSAKGSIKGSSKGGVNKKSAPSAKSPSSSKALESSNSSSNKKSNSNPPASTPQSPPSSSSSSWLDSLISTATSLDTQAQTQTYHSLTSKSDRIASRNSKLLKKGKPLKLNRKKSKKGPSPVPLLTRNPNSRKKYLSVDSGLSVIGSINSDLTSLSSSTSLPPSSSPPPFPPLPRKKKKKIDITAPYMQPRPSDYNGQGLARPTVFISFEDYGFQRRFEEQFGEHVDGFYGKVKVKGMKKQRKREEEEKRKDMFKGMEGMTADEKVEVLMRKGLL
mmetsp:Transcript_15137/g.28194  ORF Transcript_15137/g.28194 Transcript_15137/m.28194 type:complete len:292 (+) Transcript_15137:279-1154(+)|eukprot:CAMPEP_0182494480 /NCGR_PEP_ID=MMETSP1321-20130603/3355_1 /TAXON_ID=91990 /ORGANISM="Bolidomonas sp., Strain RCC1657" /LENGTH=291 /DNA_ID=CAMNT_0024697577 /DNA_START=248 /DNA_END=1119 /DNA_ORIENTATION=+